MMCGEYILHLFFCFEVSKFSEEFNLRRELSRLQEMKQTEEFLHSVLERCAGQQHLMFLGGGTREKMYTNTQNTRIRINLFSLNSKLDILQVSTHQVQHIQAVQKFAVAILEAVSLIDDDTSPGYLPQLWAVRQHHLKGCDEGIELVCTRDQMLLETEF